MAVLAYQWAHGSNASISQKFGISTALLATNVALKQSYSNFPPVPERLAESELLTIYGCPKVETSCSQSAKVWIDQLRSCTRTQNLYR